MKGLNNGTQSYATIITRMVGTVRNDEGYIGEGGLDWLGGVGELVSS